MKKIFNLILLAGFGLTSCVKSNEAVNVKLTPLASFNVTNAVVGGATLYLNTSVEDSVVNNGYSPLTVLAGQSVVDLHPVTAPTTPYFNQTISTADGSYYSLFLAGASPASVDHILIRESYKNYTDSVCAVRFINLSPDSQPISVDIQGNANGSEVPSLAYKAYTGFKQYPAKVSTPTYNFEFRDAATGTLLASYTLNTPYFHNVTLAYAGLPANPAVILDNDY